MYNIGIDLGGTNIKVGVVNDDFKIVGKSNIKTDLPRPAEEIADSIAKGVELACKEAGIDVKDINSIGIGTPGVADRNTGVVLYSCNLGFNNTDLGGLLKHRLGTDIYVENDANVAAYGEVLGGAAKGYKDVVVITLGTGVGGGIIIGGKIYTGFNFCGAELGHVVIEYNGRQCNCGRKGCFEAYSSATALITATKKAMEEDKDSAMWNIAGSIDKVDGKTAFTGGINLADEYIDKLDRFGHWKDTAVMVKGDAVKSFTYMFLKMWNVAGKKDRIEQEEIDNYIINFDKDECLNDFDLKNELIRSNGYVIPYGDSPFSSERIGKRVYIDILNRAQRYVHIMTPYLILDDEMIAALRYCAARGVETTIIMPHIPDKVYAYLLARTYYPELIKHGVNIYEYTPGFVHAKEFISDDCRATVGTVNLDFRSLYLHFECGAYIYKNDVVADIENDYQKTLEKCQKITEEDCKKYPWHKKLIGQILRLLAPLM